jgi:spermidine synthase
MQLAKHLAQGRLVYLSQQQDAITVSENDSYRWMAFSDVVQSVMNKRKPCQLTLPHQIALMLPLLFFRPTRIIELGLGGGNLTRFLQHLSTDINLTTIEHSQHVIDSFEQHFNPQQTHINIVCADGMSWLKQQNAEELDWLICDVYQSQEFGFNAIVEQLETLSHKLAPQSCLSINLPDISDSDINLCLTILQQLQPNHHITYFNIPNYLNIVIHLTPHHWPLHKLIKRNKQSYLSQVTLQRWRQFWPHGVQLN